MREIPANSITPKQCDARICGVQEINPDFFVVILEAPEIAQNARPGQFIMLRIPSHGNVPLLRRPFSICCVEHHRIFLLIQVRGTGTRILQTCAPGQILNVIGPLGNGFSVPESLREAVIVAGGIGIAPLIYLTQCIQTSRPRCSIRFFYGARTRHALRILDQFSFLPAERYISTEDGSEGCAGMITDLLTAWVESEHIQKHSGACVYGCGPHQMLSLLAALTAPLHIHCQVSLEATMACGVGACMGCCISDSSGGYTRVCVDGPVFVGSEVF